MLKEPKPDQRECDNAGNASCNMPCKVRIVPKLGKKERRAQDDEAKRLNPHRPQGSREQ